MNNTGYMRKGFTLVELLIVIGLLGAIALIVISAINPIEQANKARDARFRADGGQMVSAIERFYASNSRFPWEAGSITAEDALVFVTASNTSIGLCGTASCNDQTGTMIAAAELKSEFLTRDWVKATDAAKQIHIGKAAGSSSSVYACFVPLAKSTKDAAIANDTVRALSFTTGGLPADGACLNSASTTNWGTLGCYVCIPE